MKAAVIGLGSMGWGAAVSLLRAGIETTGHDIVEDAVERLRRNVGLLAVFGGPATLAA